LIEIGTVWGLQKALQLETDRRIASEGFRLGGWAYPSAMVIPLINLWGVLEKVTK